MADPATNTTYPGALDPLPEIGPNDKQNDPAIEHDVMHDRANAVLNALQLLIGTLSDAAEAESVLGRLLALSEQLAGKLGDAPQDGVAYVRQDGDWVADSGGPAGAVDSVNGQMGTVELDASDVGAATAAQGALADSATQPGDLAAIATSGAVGDLTGFPGGTAGYLREDGTFAAPPTGAASRNVVSALSIATGVVDIDWALGDFFTLTLNANVTGITFSNLPATGVGASIAVRIRQDTTGGRTVALPSSFKATGGTDTAVQAAANTYTLLTMTSFDQGTRWEYAMQDAAT